MWIQQKAKELDAKTISSLMNKMSNQKESTFANVRNYQVLELMMTPELMAEVREQGMEKIAKSEKWKEERSRIQNMVDMDLFTQLIEFNGGQHEIRAGGQEPVLGVELASLLEQMGAAWRDNDSDKFNGLTEEYLSLIHI